MSRRGCEEVGVVYHGEARLQGKADPSKTGATGGRMRRDPLVGAHSGSLQSSGGALGRVGMGGQG